ncbi:MFS transporter [Kribbella sandramycini]|uniref:MFS family permease n=1 Tax=Kribbella sandramycini TaxID=60450 RepID=A0A7Y4L8S6_9ACTN|nr:MFS transporter [Kribbella sandramycini]MBB6570051.1 MFS family permease [Kribbella sandramycini]NOL45446.1 MFS transporter [Kribbella sandramycini]
MSSKWLPAAGAGRGLALAQLANAVGDGAFVVTSALFFTRVVGLSEAEVGLGLTVAWLVGFLAGVPLGNLADRRGARGVAVLLAVSTAVSVSAFLFVRSFPLFVIAAIAYACSQTGLTAARQALLAGLIAPAERTRIRAFLQATVNGGLAVGALAGGVALKFDTEAAYLTVFALDGVSFLLAAWLLHRVPRVAVSVRVAGEPRLAVLRDRPYAVLALLNSIMLLFMPLLSLIGPLWIVTRTDAPSWAVASLMIVNTLGVTFFQVRVARGVRDLRTATRAIRYGGVAMLGACAVFAVTALDMNSWAAAATVVVASALLTLGEMKAASGAWEISFGLAPADKQGQYQGFFGTGPAIARMLGPALLTTVVLGWGPIGWIAVGALFLGTSALTGPAVKWAARTRAVSVDGSVASV